MLVYSHWIQVGKTYIRTLIMHKSTNPQQIHTNNRFRRNQIRLRMRMRFEFRHSFDMEFRFLQGDRLYSRTVTAQIEAIARACEMDLVYAEAQLWWEV